MKKSLYLLLSPVIALVVTVSVLFGLDLVRDLAEPAAAATQEEIVEFAFFAPNTAVATTTCSSAVNARVTGGVETHTVFTMSNTVNTATLTLQHSNFNPATPGSAHWVDGAEISAGGSVVTHVNAITNAANIGVFTRLCVTLDNTETVRVNARGKFYPGSNY